MIGKRYWLDGVRDILQARTGDLRKLASLGGENPASFYIGTSMNGVDIKGQDLRGMVFTDLDLSRVNYDDATRIDPQSQPRTTDDQISDLSPHPDRIIDPFAVVYCNDDTIFRLIKNDDPNMLVFDKSEWSTFVSLAKTSLKCFQLFRSNNRKRKRAAKGDKVVGIAIRDANARQLTNEEKNIAATFGSQVIFVQPAVPQARAYSAEVRIAVQVLALADRLYSDTTKEPQVGFFGRANGAGSEWAPDCLTQLFARLVRTQLPITGGILFNPFRPYRDRELDFQRALFPEFKISNILKLRLENAAFPDLACVAAVNIFVEDNDNTRDIIALYGRGILSVLQINGWQVDVDKNYTINSPSPVDVFYINSRMSDLSYRVEIPFVRIIPNQLRHDLPHGLSDFAFRNIRTITVSENFNYSLALDYYLSNSILVTARDLSRFIDDFGSVWILLASQLRRLTGFSSSRDRTIYLLMIIKHLDGSDLLTRELSDLIDSDIYSRGYELTLLSANLNEGTGRCAIRLDRRDAKVRSNRTAIVRFDIVIDIHGPHLADLNWDAPL